jgi:caa(3)-type oxidase subunit IV
MIDRVRTTRSHLLVEGALIVLTLANIGLAGINLRGLNAIVALLIAAAQACLIALFFMELKFSSPLPRLVGVASIVWLGILMVGTLDDLLTRVWIPVPGK